MGARYSAIAKASRMTDLPDEDKLKCFRGMVTEEERLDIGQAYYEDGILDAKTETAQKMLQKGYSIEEISDITGLSEPKVLALKNA